MVYVGLGTNLGDREQQLHTALRLIEEQMGKVVSLSALYVTKPWGFVSGHAFLNAAAAVDTLLEPLDILGRIRSIERRMGRTVKSTDGQYADRPIDIDLLLYDDRVINTPDLCVPHPLMHRRAFVMQPMAEIAPRMVHPVLGKTMKELWDELRTS